MPVRLIQRKPQPFLNTAHGEAASIGIDSDSEELKYCGSPSGTLTTYVVPPALVITVDVNASSVDKAVFIADANYIVTKIQHMVSTGASGATVVPRKCTGTTAPASGTSLLSAGSLDLNATANTTTTATLSGTAATLAVAAGDRIALDFSGTLTGLVGIVTLVLRRAE